MAVDSNLPIPQYPISEPSSVLNFGNLLTEVAYKIGCAYYGSDGTGAPQPPIDAHDLAVCSNIVNKAVRMFINDGPQPNGWKWIRPIAQIDLWPQISADPNTVPSYYVNIADNGDSTTTLTLTSPGIPNPNFIPATVGVIGTPAFYPTMELRTIWLNGNPPPNTAGFFVPNSGNGTLPVACTISDDGTNATLTIPTGVAGWVIGNTIQITNATNNAYNGNWLLISPTPSGTHATFASPTGTPTSGITAQVLFLGQVGTPFTVLSYISATQIIIDNGNGSDPDASNFPTNCPFSFASTGDYTMPADFGGQYAGEITYIANTNRGSILRWVDEGSIRTRRQNYNIETGTPYEAAVRIMPTPSYRGLTNVSGLMTPRRRWELMTWRISSEFLSIIFPYVLSFNSLGGVTGTNLSDISPAPFAHDEAVKAACLAVAEKEVEDTLNGPDWTYYHTVALPASFRIDAMSAPKGLGYFSNPSAAGGLRSIKDWRQWYYQRPTVPFYS